MDIIKLAAIILVSVCIGFFGGKVLDDGSLGAATNFDALVINEEGTDQDTRIEGDTDTQLFFADASVDSVSVGGFTYGTGCSATTSSGIVTEAVLLANSCFTMTATGAGQAVISLTLPATSTMTTLIPDAGDCRDWFVDASALSAATTTTIVAGTGHNVVGLDATGAGTGADVIDGAEYGQITMCREADTDVVTFIREWIAAD